MRLCALALVVGRSCWVASSCVDDGDRKSTDSRMVSAQSGDDAVVHWHVERGSELAAWTVTVPEGDVPV